MLRSATRLNLTALCECVFCFFNKNLPVDSDVYSADGILVLCFFFFFSFTSFPPELNDRQPVKKIRQIIFSMPRGNILQSRVGR